LSFTTIPVSNAELTAAMFAALINELRPIRAEKTSNGTAFPSTTTLANETGMAVAVVAGVEYDFDAVIVYEAGVTADIKLAWTFPTATFFYSASTISAAGSFLPIASAAEASGTAKTFGGQNIGVPVPITYTGFITVSSSGSLQLQRAQSVSTAENTRINAGSWMRIRQAV
jgi:hypothetical protein